MSRVAFPFLISVIAAVLVAARPGRLFERFSGRLPCADCAAIHLELTLYSAPATYQLKQTYEAAPKGNTTYTEQGTWITVHGSANNPYAIVYELHSARSDSKQFYLRANKNTLRLLNNRKQELPPNLPHTLQRIK